ncbi:mitochondrial adenine nucleotide transporter ADNT1-like [Papaver somniferum]|uniref:mitochondrial adenine nucleotide transporter ADNT1-like n=1 Tax=Papaver somniferum TaxID=3469 RepID=UPI000E700260|nr:mitochondrial adenine nucleotide transporter ADNT1-like [Papaver somniferum]
MTVVTTALGQVVYTGLNSTVYQSLRIISPRVLRQMLEATPGFDYTDMKPEDMKLEVLEEMRAYGKKLPFFYVFAFAAAIEFTGMCDAFKKTIRNDGFKALYRGLVPNLLLKAFPASVASVIHYGLMEGLGLEVLLAQMKNGWN